MFDFFENCKANCGNTEICGLLQLSSFKSRLNKRNIFIISDGHINNERAVFSLIRDENFSKNNCRLFTFGCRWVWKKIKINLHIEGLTQ